MNNRKLASIQTIKSVTPIMHPTDGSETTLAIVRFENIAWQCVAKRDEFKAGDKAVYIEISSIVPDHPVFEFLRSKKFKVKTIRLLGVLSQGLAIPISKLAEFYPEVLGVSEEDFNESFTDGTDVTLFLGVLRPEPAPEYKITGSGKVRTFPIDIAPKTDEMRIQSVPFILNELKDVDFYAFNIYDRETGEYKPQYYFMNELDSYGIKYAPMVYHWTKFDETVESLLELAKGYYGGTNNHREGIVLRPYFTERYSFLVGGRLSCKVINNDYLLGGGE